MANEWQLLYLLPNLALPESSDLDVVGGDVNSITLGQPEFAIASYSDPRISALRQSVATRALLDAFTDELGRPVRPSVLIARTDSPPRLLGHLEPATAFRNAAAIAYLLLGRAKMLNAGGGMYPTWSDTFDFHPSTINHRGSIITDSPALVSGGIEPHKFSAKPPAHLPVHRLRRAPESYLARTLGREWRRRYVSPGKDDAFNRALFRSIESAYRACATPWQQQGSLQDYGAQAGNWVSAIEILAQPTKGHVKPQDVLTLLDRYQWRSEALQRHVYKVHLGGKRRSVTAVQRLYMALYNARSKFIHGDKVSATLLTPKLGSRRVGVTRAAALIYRAALGAYLEERYPRASLLTPKLAGEIFEFGAFDRGLNALLNGRD